MNDNTITFKIRKQFGVIAENPSGWKKELNLVSWNQGFSKFDIRDWDNNHERMSKGITLSISQAEQLLFLLEQAFSDRSWQMETTEIK